MTADSLERLFNTSSVNGTVVLVENNATMFGNMTDDERAIVPRTYMSITQQVVAVIIYSIVICLAIGGNAIVCYVVITSRRMRTAINMFIVSLAISDLLMATFCIPFSFMANVLLSYWPFGEVMCPIVTYLQAVVVFMSTFTLIAISVDRYIAIIHPLRTKMSKKNVMVAIGVIWIVSFLLPLPTAITSRIVVFPNDTTHRPLCLEIWHFEEYEHNRRKTIYSTLIMVLQYFVPVLILMFTYGRIAIIMWVKKVPGEAQSARDKRITESKKKIIKMMVAVVIIYAVCWLPLHIITIAGDIDDTIYDNVPNMALLWMFAHWLAMSNSCYNPMVYCWMNSRFRDGFKRVLCSCCCKPVLSQTDMEMTRFGRQDTVISSMPSSYRRTNYHLTNMYGSPSQSPATRNGRFHLLPSSTVNDNCSPVHYSRSTTVDSDTDRSPVHNGHRVSIQTNVDELSFVDQGHDSNVVETLANTNDDRLQDDYALTNTSPVPYTPSTEMVSLIGE